MAAVQLSFLPGPTARRTDPYTSGLAAATVAPGNSDLIVAIRDAVRTLEVATHFQIARLVMDTFPGRWDEGTVRTACARAQLVKHDENGRSPRGRACARWRLA
jgi:hypothetical protein